MSWIFTILLIGYGFARAWWWFRGQVRYRQLQGDSPKFRPCESPRVTSSQNTPMCSVRPTRHDAPSFIISG